MASYTGRDLSATLDHLPDDFVVARNPEPDSTLPAWLQGLRRDGERRARRQRGAQESRGPGVLADDRKLKYQLADLAALPNAAVVVEDRYSQIFKHSHVRPSVIADGPAECQVAWPNVPIVFLETRALAQEWTYRFLAAARSAREHDLGGDLAVRGLVSAKPLAPAEPTVAEVRAWALQRGLDVSDRGRLPREVVETVGARGSAERQTPRSPRSGHDTSTHRRQPDGAFLARAERLRPGRHRQGLRLHRRPFRQGFP